MAVVMAVTVVVGVVLLVRNDGIELVYIVRQTLDLVQLTKLAS